MNTGVSGRGTTHAFLEALVGDTQCVQCGKWYSETKQGETCHELAPLKDAIEAVRAMRTQFRNVLTATNSKAVKWNIKNSRFFDEAYERAIMALEAVEN